jgi:hypothetical protein
MTAWTMMTGRLWHTASPPGALPPSAIPADQRTFPAPGHEESEQPLGTPAAPPVRSDSYRFVSTGPDGQGFVAYDPCRPIHYVVAGKPPRPDAGRLLAEAVARVSAASGLVFIADGATAESPRSQRSSYQPERYGDRWAPVLIAWTSPAEEPDLAGDRAGQAGSSAVQLAQGPRVYVSGQVELDAPQLAGVLGRPGGRDIVRGIIQHELAHLLGLDHVNDPEQLMFAQSVPGVTDFAAGDLTGLSVLGTGPCAPEI